ncbi:MAG: thiol peroxidase [Anaerolineae bacterium]|nr:thiol peroxidase [Anaerolineae bacterium]
MKIGTMEHPVEGAMLQVGSPAPDFKLTANDWTMKTLSDYAGKVKILSIVPSLDTRVCSAQTRRFNEEAAAFGDDVVVLTISADLPYAQRRWCGAEGIERVVTLSDHKDMNFSDVYGVHVTDLRICQRACFVVDQNNVVQFVDYVPVIGEEINFVAALSAVQKLV